MADEIVLVDTSILIDFYRKTDKANSVWIALIRQGYRFAISAITQYEIYSGASQSQLTFWDSIFQEVTVIPFDESAVNAAVRINVSLKRKRKQIALADLFIAATAVSHQTLFATLNRKHFDRIEELTMVE